MKDNKIFNKRNLLTLLAVILSATLHAFVFSNFTIPADLYPGGFSGVSKLISDVLEDFAGIKINFSIIYLLMNSLAFCFVFKTIGKRFSIFSAIQFILASVLTNVFKQVIKLDDILLYSVFGGILNGFAVGIALKANASTGGTDFISVFLSMKYKKSFWNYVFCFNVFVLILAGMIYNWNIALYSIIFQFCSTTIINRMNNKFSHRTLIIITSKPDEVCEAIFNTMRHGITRVKCEGGYLHKEMSMLFLVVYSYQSDDVISCVMETDPKAFISIQDSKDVVGNFYQIPMD